MRTELRRNENSHWSSFEMQGQPQTQVWNLNRFALMTLALINSGFLGCTQSTAPEGATATAANPISVAKERTELQVRDLIDATIKYNLNNRLMSAERNAAWQVLHGLIAYDRDLPLQVEGERKQALEYLLNGGELSGWILFPGTKLPNGRTGVRSHLEAGGYRSQGHVDQWLAIMAQMNIPIDTKVVVAGQTHTVADWIDQALLDVPNNPLEEYSWTVISAVHYRPELEQWMGIDGTSVDLESLVEFEAEQDINTSACGGSHRLMALAKAVEYARKRNILDKPGYQLAEQTLKYNLNLMRRYQNSDGSFSANYFERPGASADLGLMISATGHQIEVAAFALSQEELKSKWLERAVVRFCEMLEATKDQPLEAGGLYHGLKGLRIYYQRRFPDSNPG